ncbi:MAG: ABC transporter permease, partial [Methanoregula sp.]|nr:ABC transporter permease [Methanoregula sp.]
PASIAFMILGKMSIAGLLEKRRDIGVLQSIGWTRKDIMVQVTAEFSLKVFTGCVIGVLAAMAFAATLGAVAVQVRPTGLEEPVAISAPLVISPLIALGYSVLVFCIALAVFVFVGRRMVSRKPGENLRSL